MKPALTKRYKPLSFSIHFIALLFAALLSINSYAQTTGGVNNTGGVSIVQGTNRPHESAMLDVVSTNKGVLLPRMTTLQRLAIDPPTTGLLVFDTDEQGFYYVDNDLCWRELESHKTSPTAGDACDQSSGKVPVGGIIMYSGATTDFDGTGLGIAGTQYEGWAICNGANGTPDLRDRFVVSVGSKYSLGDNTGGADEITLTEKELPAHKHDVNASVLKVTIPPHNHTLTQTDHVHLFPSGNGTAGSNTDKGGGGGLGDYQTKGAQANITLADAAQATGIIDIDQNNFVLPTSGGGLPFDNRPPLYALLFMMRTK